MKNTIIAIPSSYIVITTIVYALLASIFLEMNNALGGVNFIVINDDKTMMYSQQVEAEIECKSPCPSTAEVCIQMCA